MIISNERAVWLAHLKPGNEVLVKTSRSRTICKVERLTPTQIIINNAFRFRRSDGEEHGGQPYNRRTLEQVEPEDLDRREAQQLAKRLTTSLDLHLKNARLLPLETLRQMCALTKASDA